MRECVGCELFCGVQADSCINPAVLSGRGYSSFGWGELLASPHGRRACLCPEVVLVLLLEGVCPDNVIRVPKVRTSGE